MQNVHLLGQAIVRLAVVMALTLSLMSCSKVTEKNYHKLGIGMAYAAAVELLGEPVGCEAIFQAKSCTWGTAPKTITVKFIADKVVVFSNTGL